jgi:hypothetical protein
MNLHTLLAAASLAVLGAAACSPAAEKAAPASETAAKEAAASTCPDDGPRLPGTGLCRGRAVNYFDPARLTDAPGDLPEGQECTFVINETMTPDANEAILYRASSCNGKTTTLEFSIGARSASLGRATSGLFDQLPAPGEEGWEVVRIFRLEGVADPKAMILEIAKGNATEEQVKAAEVDACEVRPAGDGFPVDAVLVDVNDAYKQASKLGPYDPVTDGPGAGVYAACGSYGITDASGDYWMIRDGYAWFVRLGQDLPDFDASSLTVFTKGADGSWGPKG